MEKASTASSDIQAAQARPRLKEARKRLLSAGLRSISWAAPGLARIGFVRKPLVKALEKSVRQGSLAWDQERRRPARIIEDRMYMTMAIFKTIERALAQNRLSKAAIRRVIKNFAHDIVLQ